MVKITVVALFIFSVFTAAGQDWKQISTDEKRELLLRIKEENKIPKGCQKIAYTIYNFSLNSSPLSTYSGIQCFEGERAITNIFSQSFTYIESGLVVDIDSTNMVMSIGYDLAGEDARARGESAFEELLKHSEAVLVKEVGSEPRVLKIASTEANGIEYYLLNLDKNLKVAKVEIHYEETEDEYYGREKEISKPIMVISYESINNPFYSSMLSMDYFLEQEKETITTSDQFSNFKLEDLRIDLTK